MRGQLTAEPETSVPSNSARRLLNGFSIGIVAVYGLLFVLFFQRSGPRDHDQFIVFHELQYWNTALFGLAKQWTPLMCSGLSLAGEPQVPFMSLSMMLSYVLGPLWGLKLATMVYFVAGWVGAFLYAGLWLRQFGQRALAAALFIGNGFFICRLGFGHIDFIPFLTLPLMLWVLHLSIGWKGETWTYIGALRQALATVLMAGAIAVAIDGSPVAIIHLLFWIGLYGMVLAITARSVAPVILLGCALSIALLLDAGYLWPMLQAQTVFPRHRPDRFTSLFSLLWFALLPVRGKLLPANGNGHELSVFIGPVMAYLLWHYRHWLAANLPTSMKRPLLVVSIVSIVLGMGSLKPLHIPLWLSPFDLLRPLPGFRSIGVTGRYWGFLALPLSLLAAAALWRFATEHHDPKRVRLWLSFALLLQLGFQTETVLGHWMFSEQYRPRAFRSAFRHGMEDIEYVRSKPGLQGEFITPTRGVVDCYDEDDFIKADVGPGRQLVKRVLQDGKVIEPQGVFQAGFVTWSHIRLRSQNLPPIIDAPLSKPAHVQVVLNQAFHPFWQAAGCQTARTDHGNLIVDCPMARLRDAPVDLEFNDALSEFAATISTRAWGLWMAAIGGLCFLGIVSRRKIPAVDAVP